MNIFYIWKFHYKSMIELANETQKISLATDEEPSPKWALDEDGSRGNI